jgi:hypothetical protein
MPFPPAEKTSPTEFAAILKTLDFLLANLPQQLPLLEVSAAAASGSCEASSLIFHCVFISNIVVNMFLTG